jgi:hypothetical protein
VVCDTDASRRTVKTNAYVSASANERELKLVVAGSQPLLRANEVVSAENIFVKRALKPRPRRLPTTRGKSVAPTSSSASRRVARFFVFTTAAHPVGSGHEAASR